MVEAPTLLSYNLERNQKSVSHCLHGFIMEFTLFPQLPTELRLKVWRCSFPDKGPYFYIGRLDLCWAEWLAGMRSWGSQRHFNIACARRDFPARNASGQPRKPWRDSQALHQFCRGQLVQGRTSVGGLLWFQVNWRRGLFSKFRERLARYLQKLFEHGYGLCFLLREGVCKYGRWGDSSWDVT